MIGNIEKESNVTIIRLLENRFDAAKSPELKTFLLDVIEEGNNIIGLDMTTVEFIDSSGLGALVSALKKIGQNGKLVLWGLSKEVRMLFELTQLYKVFDIFETEQDALKQLD